MVTLIFCFFYLQRNKIWINQPQRIHTYTPKYIENIGATVRGPLKHTLNPCQITASSNETYAAAVLTTGKIIRKRFFFNSKFKTLIWNKDGNLILDQTSGINQALITY